MRRRREFTQKLSSALSNQPQASKVVGLNLFLESLSSKVGGQVLIHFIAIKAVHCQTKYLTGSP